MKGEYYVEVFVFDGITLFGANNVTTKLADGAGSNGVHFNDVDQGSVGDCYLNAALAALALQDPARVRALFFNPDGVTPWDGSSNQVSFWFFRNVNGPAEKVTVDLSLDHGIAQSQLRNDTDALGNYEVWMTILEKAYREFIGFEDLNNGGSPAAVWEHLLNSNHFDVDATDMTQTQIEAYVRSQLAAGKKLVLNTYGSDKVDKEWYFGSTSVVGNHSYAVIGIDDMQTPQDTSDDIVKLYNPWGNELEIPVSSLKRITDSLSTHGERP
jgi:hypothetical protein